MNIFDQAPEFIEWDNRQFRKTNQVTAESTYNRLSVQLPTWLVKDATVLDLGSCLGAAGHMALSNGASYYTGVEIQDKYVNDSRTILSKYWPGKFDIVQAELEGFLDKCILEEIKFDVVVASGVLYAFLDIVKILEKISRVSNKTILVDTMYVQDAGNKGVIIIKNDSTMVYAEGAKTFTGIGSTCNLTALDIIFKTCGFFRTEDAIIPPITTGSHDGYSDKLDQGSGLSGPSRYAARYYKSDNKVKKLLDTVIENKSTDAEDFYQVPKIKETAKVWEFDNSVADRFQQEARDHIPDYSRVIDQCIQLAKDNLKPGDAIIDIGSALGYTVDQFIKAGFTNMWGLDNSEAMYAKTLHQDRIILANELPKQKYKMILINWTFHFIVDKAEYLATMYDRLEPGGYLILSDKTTQSAEVKKMYYDFKRANGVAESYIQEKEKKLAGYMYTVPSAWYQTNFEKVGFTSIEVLNAKVGFVTYLCKRLA